MTDSIHVLHVDDEPGFAEMAAEFLEREDDRFTVETETSASDGLDRLAGSDVDCIISDYDMPGQNGIELLETVREDYPDLPFILYTGKGSEEVASDAISAGATDYLQKAGGTDQYELLANRVLNAVGQYRATRRAAELDRIRTLASDINQALVRAGSRSEAETRVCEIISDSDPYLFAWIGEVDPETDRIEPRTSAGIENGYLEEITITADDTPTGQGPGGTAIRERHVAVSQNVAEDPEFAPWREEALERGFRAAAAVPLEYGDTLYGELVVYAERPDAFDEDERDLLTDIGTDISHALRSFDIREQLRGERDRRRALFENAPSPVIAGEIHEGGTQHRIADVNNAFQDVFGYGAEEIIGRDVAEVIVPEEEMDRHEEFRERAAAGKATITEVERSTADGSREFLLTNIPYGMDEEPAEGWYSWFTDITERREREQAIEDLHTTVREFMDAETPETVAEIAVDAVRDILDMPANAVHLYDESEDCLPPVAWTDQGEELVGEVPTFQPGDGLAWEVFETGETQVYDDVSTTAGRISTDTEVRSEIILPLDDHGVLLIGSGTSDAFDETDVSLAHTLAAHTTTALDRIEREDELRRRQELFEALLETSIDGILVVDENREYVTWNQQFIDMWGIPEELVGDNPEKRGLEWALDQLENPDEFIEKVEYLYEHPGEESRDQVRLADGRVFDRYSAPVEADDGAYFGRVWFFRDITERVEREQELERYETILEALGDPVYALDADGHYTFVNDAYATELGYSEDEIVGGHVSHVLPENEIEKATDVVRGLLADDERTKATVEQELITAGGEHVRMETHIALLPPGEGGEFRGTAGVIRDITDRKERERELERQNERLEEFASIVSHDLRNPLNVAKGRLELAREEYDSDHLDAVARSHQRMGTLIEDLLTLAREGDTVAETERIDLAELAEDCWRNVDTMDATFIAEIESTIKADRSRLGQLLENLFRNAVEHGGEDVTVTIGDLNGGFYIADDGPGIPEDEREQVFEFGYSISDAGTGFGLAIVEEIAEAHGWDITVTDSVGGGARFEIIGVEVADE